MCDEPDYYYDVQDSKTHCARKQHTCCACGETIERGHRYVRSFACSKEADSLGSYKHCLRCWAMLDAVMKARPGDAVAWELNCGEDWRDTIGELPEEVAALAFMSQEDAQRKLAERPVKALVGVP